jgi:ubiquinone biosynthesis protein
MDYIDGVRPTDPASLRAAGIDPAAIAALGADVVLDMVLINGRFHADPHPGNLLCLPGNRIALLDLGMIGHVSPRRREEFVGFVQALQRGDPALLADILGAWSAGARVAPAAVRSAADRLVARHGGQLVLRAIVTDLLVVMRETGLVMPSDLLLIFKALITIDGVLAAIQPDFDLSAALRRASLRIVRARLSADHWAPVVQGLAWELGQIGDDAPRLLRLLVRRLEAEPVVPVAVQPDRAGPRWIAAAILAGATLVAAAGLLG